LTALLPALAGANLIYGLGMFESGCTMDYGQLFMDNEFAEMIKYVLRGVPVNEDTLAVDMIAEVGQFKEFVSQPHTLANMRTHQTYPKLIDRLMREDWDRSGQKTIHDRAWEEATDVLDTYQPEPLPESVRQTIRDIRLETEKEMGIPQKTPAAGKRESAA